MGINTYQGRTGANPLKLHQYTNINSYIYYYIADEIEQNLYHARKTRLDSRATINQYYIPGIVVIINQLQQ